MYRTLAIGAGTAALLIGAGIVLAGQDKAPVPEAARAPAPEPVKAAVAEPVIKCVWPTPYPRLSTPLDDTSFLQATASGNPASGGYGMVRDAGSRFHEGIDIRPVARDRKGEPADDVVAAFTGRVAYVNTRANGAYGKYVVLEHQAVRGLTLYTLYAHLASVDPLLREGTTINEGTRIGLMGRTDGGGGFPRERAHLHFEIGFRLSENFNRWYASKRYPDPNAHDNFNGINLSGLDPAEFYRRVRENNGRLTADQVRDWVKSTPVSVVVETPATGKRVPSFLRRNPALAGKDVIGKPAPAGWRIGFTAYGTPVSWQPLAAAPAATTITLVDGPLAADARRRGLITTISSKRQRYAPGSSLETALALLAD